MIFKTKNNNKILTTTEYKLDDGSTLPLLKFPLLEETGIVEHCFTTRLGGVSKEHLSSLNLSFSRGDNPANVYKNYERLAQALNVSTDDFVFTDQTHTTNVLRVDASYRGFSLHNAMSIYGNKNDSTIKSGPNMGLHNSTAYSDIDGLVTNESGLVLSTFYADCVPLYFVDPIHHAIGLSHSGWKGTVGRMGLKTLQKMQEEFGTNPADVIAAIAPSICQDCYEISEDVAVKFMEEFPEHVDEILIEKQPTVNSVNIDNKLNNSDANNSEFQKKYQLDLWKCNEIILLEAGIKKDHLAVTNICTCCNSDLLFSHRATNGKRGNLGAFMYLK